MATIGISDGWLGPDPVRVEGAEGRRGDTVPALPGGRPELDGLIGLASPGPRELPFILLPAAAGAPIAVPALVRSPTSWGLEGMRTT